MAKLDAEWKRDLKSAGVDFFHAKEHWNMAAKPYHGISKTERENLLSALVGHFHHRFLFAVSAIVNETEYRNVASDRFRSQQGSPYAFAFQLVMTCIYVRLREQNRLQPVNIFIEDGHANAKQAMKLIEAKKTRVGGLKINSHGLGGKKDNPTLQAADMLAFGVSEFHAKGRSDFAARLSPKRFFKRILELPWDKSAVDAVKEDITRNMYLKKTGFPGAKRLSELTMW